MDPNNIVIKRLWCILKILWKRGEIAPNEQCLFSRIFCCLLLDFSFLEYFAAYC